MSFFILYINIIFLRPVLVNLTKIKYLSNFYSNINEIHLIIKGEGTQALLNSAFNKEPSSVLINGILNNLCKKSCDLNIYK